MAPHSQSIQSVSGSLDATFVQSHVVYCNPSNPLQFVSLNGIRGIFSPKYDSIQLIASVRIFFFFQFIINKVPTNIEEIRKFKNDPYYFFQNEYVV